MSAEPQKAISVAFPGSLIIFLETDSTLIGVVVIHNGTGATRDKKRQKREKV